MAFPKLYSGEERKIDIYSLIRKKRVKEQKYILGNSSFLRAHNIGHIKFYTTSTMTSNRVAIRIIRKGA